MRAINLIIGAVALSSMAGIQGQMVYTTIHKLPKEYTFAPKEAGTLDRYKHINVYNSPELEVFKIPVGMTNLRSLSFDNQSPTVTCTNLTTIELSFDTAFWQRDKISTGALGFSEGKEHPHILKIKTRLNAYNGIINTNFTVIAPSWMKGLIVHEDGTFGEYTVYGDWIHPWTKFIWIDYQQSTNLKDWEFGYVHNFMLGHGAKQMFFRPSPDRYYGRSVTYNRRFVLSHINADVCKLILTGVSLPVLSKKPEPDSEPSETHVVIID